MSQSFIPYGRQCIEDDDLEAVAQALRSDYLTTGPLVERFERALSHAAGGCPTVAMSSGTAALHAAYAAIGVTRGQEIVTSPLTFVATASTAMHLGARVVFADIDDTLTLDPAAAAAACGPDTKAITVVDYAGQPGDLDELTKVAGQNGAYLVEDASHSLGASYKGRRVGSLASITTFSFHPVKTITTAEGGAVASCDAIWLRAAARFRNHGLVRELDQLHQADEGPWHQEVQALGLNYRLPDVLAALGISQLKKLDRFVRRRAELVGRYRAALTDVDGVSFPSVREDVIPAWHLCPIRIGDGRRAEIFTKMRSAGIGVQVHYLPVYRHPLFAEAGYRAGQCPKAELAYSELMSLPLFPALSEAEQDRVISALIGALQTAR